MSLAKEGKSPVLALILSFFIPGLGQFYVGQIGKGIMFLIIDGVGWAFNFTIVGVVLGIPICLVAWIWSMVDAYMAAKA